MQIFGFGILLNPLNIVDLLSFAPTLLEAWLGPSAHLLPPGFDLRWIRIFRWEGVRDLAHTYCPLGLTCATRQGGGASVGREGCQQGCQQGVGEMSPSPHAPPLQGPAPAAPQPAYWQPAPHEELTQCTAERPLQRTAAGTGAHSTRLLPPRGGWVGMLATLAWKPKAGNPSPGTTTTLTWKLCLGGQHAPAASMGPLTSSP